MAFVDQIFTALDGPSAIARETGYPVQTVHSWKRGGNIPPWRRPAILELARRKARPLAPEVIAYLSGIDAE